AVVLAVVAVETTWSAVVTDEQRSKVLSATVAAWNEDQTKRRDTILTAQGWPQYRAEPGTSITPNDPILLGGQSAGLYSSLLPYSLNQTPTGPRFGQAGY